MKMLPHRREVTALIHLDVLGKGCAAACGRHRVLQGKGAAARPPKSPGAACGTLHIDVTWSVEDACVVHTEG